MLLKKRREKSLHQIGKSKFDFDIHQEREIYSYLCYQKIKKAKEKELSKKNLLFDYYNDWKGYILKKYSKYDNDTLIEFSRYLTQRERNVKPLSAYGGIILTIILTEFISMLLKALLSVTSIDVAGAPWYAVLAIVILIIVILVASALIIMECWDFYYQNSKEEYFFEDYKEIIDGMINKKKNEIKD